MAEAEVGDDVFMENPTVARLEALAAERLGKEAALFVTSGTQGNQVSLMAHTQRGEEIILDENCHIFNYEVAALAVLSAVSPGLRGRNGILDRGRRDAIRPPNIHHRRTRSSAWRARTIAEAVDLSDRNAAGDPADRERARAGRSPGRRRLFNACVASGRRSARSGRAG
jgi:threonine aldolase